MWRGLLLGTLLLIGCSERVSGVPPAGSVRLHTNLGDTFLYVDAAERGPLREGLEVQLSAGPHVLEARRGDVIVVHLAIEVQPARLIEVSLDGPPPPLPRPPPPPATPPPPPPTYVDPTYGPQVETPSRSEVVQAMNSVTPAVQACSDENGTVAVRVVFAGTDGRVTSTNVQGGVLSAAERECVARAVDRARVPPFARPDFAVNYPFRL